MENNKSLYLTIGISLFLFSFVTALLYIIYCYAYYDSNQELTYANHFNQRDDTFIYKNLNNDTDLTKESFDIPYNLMYDKNNLKNIYYVYYKDSTIFPTLEDFITYYYYGNVIINKNNIEFQSDQKTTLLKRRLLKYQSINLMNSKNQEISLGVKKNITLKLENNATLELDQEQLTCPDSECQIANIFGGLHTIKYTSNNHQYYSLLAINEDDETIEISTINTLIKIDKNNIDTVEQPNTIENAKVETGTYLINKCFLESSCANKKKSYLKLNEDKTAEYYTYVPFEEAGDEYIGTYEIQGNFLILSFENHTYSVFDYDTKQTTSIKAKVNTEIRLKITNQTTLTNDSYEFKYSAE